MAYRWKQIGERRWIKEYVEDASQKFQNNPEEFSKRPTALCAHGKNHISCGRGENGCCFSKLGCSAKRELDGSGRMLASEMARLNDAIAAAK